MLRDILSGKDAGLEATLELLAQTNADVLTLQGIDYDLEGRALSAFADALAARGASYPYTFAAPPNAGRMTKHDLDQDGKTGGPRDAQGYGRFFGQGAMALLSRYPIDESAVQDFTTFVWRDLPRNLYPMTPDGPWGGAQAHGVQRLASNGAWVVPVDHPDLGRVHILTYHATPPVFDGPEDRNGRRNHDETMFWYHYLNGAFGPAPNTQFIVMGDANLDPARGDGRGEAMQVLLSDSRLQDPKPHTPTVTWERAGDMRVDYVLPSADWTVTGAGLGAHPEQTSRHKLVWVDLAR